MRALDQDQEPEQPGDEARGAGRLVVMKLPGKLLSRAR